MVKLFLVEDEIIMRNGIKQIDWASQDIELVGEAGDGELAYPMILEMKPDILLTDIRMPFMDGLELSERVRRDLPDIQIIILSGYDEFTYAQKAVSLGVTEYLLKPVPPDKLLETVVRVREKIEEERKKDEDEFSGGVTEEKRELQKQRFFRHLVMNTKTSPELLDMARQLDINLTARFFCMILVTVRIEGETAGNYSQTRNELSDHLQTILSDQTGCTLFDRSENGFALLIARNSEESLAKSIGQITENVTAAAGTVKHLHYFIAVGTTVGRVSEIRSSYEQATKAASYRFLIDRDQVIYADHLPARGGVRDDGALDFSEAVANQNFREILEDFMRTGTREEIVPFVSEMFETVSEKNLKSHIFMTYVLMDMYLTMLRFAKAAEIATDDIEEKCGRMNDLLKDEFSMEAARQYIADYLDALLTKRDSNKEKRFGISLQKAVTYIDENYCRDDLSLSGVAAIANISPNHFSVLFSQEMGMTFMEYLIGRRMKKAQELLMMTDMRSSEIAYEVGYKDPHYFSHTFKKNVGMTPKEYRARSGKGE